MAEMTMLVFKKTTTKILILVSKMVPRGTVYLTAEPEFVGVMPIRQDINVNKIASLNREIEEENSAISVDTLLKQGNTEGRLVEKQEPVETTRRTLKFCKTCGKEIKNKGRTTFCSKECYRPWNYGLSVDSDIRVRKIQDNRNKIMSSILKKKYQTGEMIPWMKGLNSDIDDRIKLASIKKSITEKNNFQSGKTVIWHKGMTNKNSEIMRRMSQKKSETMKNNFKNGYEITFSKKAFRKDLGHFCRSSWEANICRILKYFDIKYQFEPKRFFFEDSHNIAHSYLPDIFLVDYNKYLEVKGCNNRNIEKFYKFCQCFPDIDIVLVDKDIYNILINHYEKFISFETNKKRVEDIVRSSQQCEEANRNICSPELLFRLLKVTDRIPADLPFKLRLGWVDQTAPHCSDTMMTKQLYAGNSLEPQLPECKNVEDLIIRRKDLRKQKSSETTRCLSGVKSDNDIVHSLQKCSGSKVFMRRLTHRSPIRSNPYIEKHCYMQGHLDNPSRQFAGNLNIKGASETTRNAPKTG